jgi:hypothetical protein
LIIYKIRTSFFWLLLLGSVLSVRAQTDSTTLVDSLILQAEEEAEAMLMESVKFEPIFGHDDDYFIGEGDTIRLFTDGTDVLDDLQEDLQQFKVFITGENHSYTKSNAKLWLRMIKYLHQNAGVRNIMFEYGYSYGYLVNEYLNTSDTSLFNSIDEFAYEPYSEAIQELKAYNDSLPEDQKLYFCALDIDRGVYPMVKMLAYLIPKAKRPHDSIYVHTQSILSLTSYNDFKLDRNNRFDDGNGRGFNFKSSATLDLVHQNFLAHEEKYKDFLGEHFEEFKKVIKDNYAIRKQWIDYESSGAIQEYIFRENFMHQRFLEEQAKREGGWFGQFGRCHATQSIQKKGNSCEWFEFNSLADRIKNTAGGSFKEKVMSVAILYKSDRRTSPSRDTIERYFDRYFNDLESNSIAVLDIARDSILFNRFGKDFNLIFLNTYASQAPNFFSSNDDDDDDVGFTGTVGFGQWNYNLEALNTAILSASATNATFVNPSVIDFMLLGSIDGIQSGLSFGFMLPQKLDNNHPGPTQLNGFYLKEVFYYDILNKVDFVSIMPGFGAGYARYKYTITETNVGGGGDGFLGDLKNTVYTNPAFTLDAGGIVDFKFGPFILGLQYAYNWDLSKPEWLSQNELSNNSPETKLTGWFSMFRVGVKF